MPVTIDERSVCQPRKAELQTWLRGAITAIKDQGVAENEDPRATPDAISPERLQLADAGIRHLSPIVRQLVDLWNEPEEEDDYGRLKPTQDAFDTSVQLLVDAAIEAHPQCRIPAGCVSTDSEGGVRIEWIQPTASVHLVVPATKDRAPFVYHQVGNDYATEDATPERLAYWLHRIE